jgi:o-succinylbenzoate synthase
MTRARASVTTRRARLARPVGSAAAQESERAGLFITLVDDDGHVGHGEASPLPGFSRDDLLQCAAALHGIAQDGVKLPSSVAAGGGPTGEPSDLETQLDRIRAAVPHDCPAARFAVETAVLDLLGARFERPAWQLLGGSGERRPLAALLRTESERELLESARAALDRGVAAVKVKLGFSPPLEEIRRLERLRAQIGPNIPIRLDANGAWPVAEAPARLAALAAIGPEFVEQPVASAELSALDRSAVPLALDEALIELSPADLEGVVDRIPVRVLVLKPMALGGIVRCFELSRWAASRGVDVVVSHLFDGPVALAACAALALAVGSPGRAMGLDPHAALGAWPPVALPMFETGAISALDRPGLGLALKPRWEESSS